MIKDLTTRQASLMFFAVTIASKLLALPALIAQVAFNDLCWVFLFSFVIDGIFFLIFMSLIKTNPNLTFRELLEKSLGKTACKIMFLLFGLYFILKAIIIAEESYVFFNETIYLEIDKFLYAFILILLVIYTSTLHLRTYGRLLEILIYIILFSLGLSLIISLTDVDLTNLLPIMANGVQPVFMAMIKHGFWFGDFMIFYYLLGNIKIEKKSTKSIFISWITASLVVMLFVVLFYGIFGRTASIHIESISEIAEYTPKLSVETRFNWIVTFIYPFLIYYIICLYCYFGHNSFSYLFNAKQKHTYWISALVIILILIVLLISNITYEKLYNFITDWFNYILLFVQYFIPLFIPLIFLLFNKKRRAKTW